MGFTTDHVQQNITTNQGDPSAASRTYSNSAFIPELWTDEMIAVYKVNIVMPQLVKTIPFYGVKGDTVHIPRPVRESGSAKVVETEVVLVASQATTTRIDIDTHWHYATLIEDVVKIQAQDTFRAFYTDDAGYALAKKVDTVLHNEGKKFAGTASTPTTEASNDDQAEIGTPASGAVVDWDPTANSNAGNAAVLTDEGIRLFIMNLDNNDVPNAGRVLVIPPVEKKNLLGIARFTETAFVGEAASANSIRNGLIGSLYNVDVYVSTNCREIAVTGTNPRVVLMFQKEAIAFVEQLRPRVQSDYILEHLGDLMVVDTMFGAGVLRPEAGIGIIVPA